MSIRGLPGLTQKRGPAPEAWWRPVQGIFVETHWADVWVMQQPDMSGEDLARRAKLTAATMAGEGCKVRYSQTGKPYYDPFDEKARQFIDALAGQAEIAAGAMEDEQHEQEAGQ
jgi:hypothetical protein